MAIGSLLAGRRLVRREQHLLTSSSWVAPANLVPGSVDVTWIAGGASGWTQIGSAGAYPAGNGGSVIRRRMTATPTTSYPAVIGAGGAKVTTGSGGNAGGDTTFMGVTALGAPAPNNQNPSNRREGGGYGGVNTDGTDGLDGWAGGGSANYNYKPGAHGGGQGADAAPNTGAGGGGGGGNQSGAGGSGRVIVKWEEYA